MMANNRLRPYRATKDSGIEWLGKIPEHWTAVPFKTLLTGNDSGVWGDDPDGESDTLVLRSTEQNIDGSWRIDDPAWRKLGKREKNEALLSEGDLVVTKSSGSQLHIGKTSYVDKQVAALGFCFSNFMQRLRLKTGNASRLYWHLMNSPVCRQQLVFLSTTTTGLGNLNGRIIGAVTVPTAPFDEQQAIADFLDRETVKIDTLVEKKERLIELLQEKRTALITNAVTKGLNPDVPMKESGIEWLGKIPEHWTAVPFKTLLTGNDSGVWGDDPDGESDTLVLRSTEQNIDGSWRIDDPAWRKLGKREKNEALLSEGDLVVTKSSGSQLHIGKTSYVDKQVAALGFCFSNFMQRLRLKTGNASRLYWHLMNSPVCRQQLVFLSTTTTGLGNLNGRIIGAVTVPTAPFDEQQAIADFLDRETVKIDALIDKVQEAIERLKEYRTALISAAVTGKIDVRGEILTGVQSEE
jgi:type I restriction enzyme, S subunit